MRAAGVLAIVLAAMTCTAGDVAAQASQPAKPKSAAPAKPAAKPAPTVAARAGYASLTPTERMTIQSDLVWTGDYNGIITPDMSERVIAAVKSFQKRWGSRETGSLSAAERQKLADEAKPKQEAAGWRLVDDSTTGVWLGLPAKLVPKTDATGSGRRWQSSRGEIQIDTFRVTGRGTTIATAFERLKKEPANRKVEYSVLRGDVAVLSGLQGLKKFYVRAQSKDEEVRGVTILYDQATEGIMDPIAVAMSSAFIAFPGGPVAGLLPPGPPPRRKVEYGSGVIVSKAGDILTDAALTEECQSITVVRPSGGSGHAAVIATDKANDLALLRVYGAGELAPARFGDTMPANAMLVGIADPQLQSGGGEATTTPVRFAATASGTASIDPVPMAGFAGAAAIDGDDRLVGVVGIKTSEAGAPPRAALVPVGAIKAFLYAQAVAPPADAGGSAKAAVARVICVRR